MVTLYQGTDFLLKIQADPARWHFSDYVQNRKCCPYKLILGILPENSKVLNKKFTSGKAQFISANRQYLLTKKRYMNTIFYIINHYHL